MTRTSNDKRLDELVDVVVQLASGNLSVRLAPSDAGDSVDAVITGINLLADELDRLRRLLGGEHPAGAVAGEQPAGAVAGERDGVAAVGSA